MANSSSDYNSPAWAKKNASKNSKNMTTAASKKKKKKK
jgi:hypothetical protein